MAPLFSLGGYHIGLPYLSVFAWRISILIIFYLNFEVSTYRNLYCYLLSPYVLYNLTCVCLNLSCNSYLFSDHLADTQVYGQIRPLSLSAFDLWLEFVVR